MSSIKIIISLKYYLLTGITLYDMQHLIRQQASEAVSLEKSIGWRFLADVRPSVISIYGSELLTLKYISSLNFWSIWNIFGFLDR